MFEGKEKGPGARPGGRLVAVYSAVAVLGVVLGAASRGGGEDPPGLEELVRKAMERIAEDEDAGDAGPAGSVAVEGGEAPVALEPSPEPVLSDGGVEHARPLPESNPQGGEGEVVILVEVTEEIEMGLPAYIERAIESHPDAAALVLEINTPGGRVDAATLIRDALLEVPDTMRTVAFIHPRAASAGAFISLACDHIFIADGGTIGAATPIDISGGEAEAVDEKFVSYFRAEMAATARAKGRRGDIAEAMVDRDVEIEGITPAGKLLTLDAAGAVRYGIADGKANSLEEVLEKLALSKAEVKGFELNWAERLAQILTSPILSGILMSVGMLGILIELYQPGFGLPGIVGIACLVIFFAGHLVVHLAGWEEVIVFVLGVALIIVEVYVSPGFGVAGVLGVLLILVSLVFSLSSLPIDVSFDTGILTRSLFRVLVSLVAVVALFATALAILPKTKLKNRLVLEAAVEGTAAGGVEGEAVESSAGVGAVGRADSYLRPAGIARFGKRRIDVASEGEFIEKGERIVVVRIEGNRVVVRKES